VTSGGGVRIGVRVGAGVGVGDGVGTGVGVAMGGTDETLIVTTRVGLVASPSDALYENVSVPV